MDLLKMAAEVTTGIGFDRDLPNPEELHWPVIKGEDNPPLTIISLSKHHEKINLELCISWTGLPSDVE